VVPYCGNQLWTSRLYLLEHGKVYFFHKKGFEPQCFLPLSEWDYNKAKAYEASLSRQGGLFEEAA
jgi:hypothetical protein